MVTPQLAAPGNDPYAITGGRDSHPGTSTRIDDAIASYSSKGPSLGDHIVKPDLVAPGNRIGSLRVAGKHLGYEATRSTGKLPLVAAQPNISASVAPAWLLGRHGSGCVMLQKTSSLSPDR